MRVAVVTGSNKGIGKEIAKKLLDSGLKCIIACRNDALGQATADEFCAAGYAAEYRQCDIESSASIDAFVSGLTVDYPCIHVLVNNAAIAFKNSDPTPFTDQAEPTMRINFFGTLELTRRMLPLLQAATDPIVVNVASQAGRLAIFKDDNNHRRSKITDPNLTIEELVQFCGEFVADVKMNQAAERGWPSTCYGTSKAAVIAMTKVFARDYPGITFNACCPGWCSTDMSSHSGSRTAEEGARVAAYLATLDKHFPSANADGGGGERPTGKFFYDMHEIEW